MNRFYIKFVIVFQLFAPIPHPGIAAAVVIPEKPAPAPVAYQKIADWPVSDFEYAQTVELLPEPQSTAPAVNARSSTNNMLQGSDCGDNIYANFIYNHESGCNPAAINSIGCYGIGQDCNGIIRSSCGADYACQNAYFNQYASKYGGWAGAYSFWLSHRWW